MAAQDQRQQFLKSWWTWRNSLPTDQRWMADAMGWSAAHGADVQGYQASQWSWDSLESWIGSQDAKNWQQWSQNWKSDTRWNA
jgi:hypothetical protein